VIINWSDESLRLNRCAHDSPDTHEKFTNIYKKNVVIIGLNFYFCSQGIHGMFVANLRATKEQEQGLSCFPSDELSTIIKQD